MRTLGLCGSKPHALYKSGICKMCHARGTLYDSIYNNHLKLVKMEKYKKKQEWNHSIPRE